MSKKVLDQAMFNIIDLNLTDINQLTDNVFNNESNLGNESTDKSNTDLEQTKTDEYQKLTTPNLEDSNSNLSLLDHALTDEEIFKYLSLFSENNFQLVDELDIENTLQPCSSINSNATTVSTQETNEFRESLLNSEVSNNSGTIDDGNQQLNNASNKELFDIDLSESNNYQNATNINQIIDQTINRTDDTDQVNNCSNTQIVYTANMNNPNIQTNKTNNDLTHPIMNCQQINNQINGQINNQICTSAGNQINQVGQLQTNNMIRNGLAECNQTNQMQSVNYFYSVNNQQMNNQQMNNLQMVNPNVNNQFQSFGPNNNIPSTNMPNNLQPIGFLNNSTSSSMNSSMNSSVTNGLIPNHNCLPNNLQNNLPNNSIDPFQNVNYYCDSNNNCATTPSSTLSNNSSSTNYLNNNEYFTFTECRDVNCPYTYCSRYNPYYNNFMSSFRNQFRSTNFNDNFLTDTSINMNLVDNQIVFNKQSDQGFNSNLIANPTTQQTSNNGKTKRTKRKANKNEFTETSVICNESTDYAFYTLEENVVQSKRKRGRKKKTETVVTPISEPSS